MQANHSQESRIAFVVVLFMWGNLGTSVVSIAHAQSESAPPGVQLLLPRGGIPAIFAPEFVSAEAARIADDAWILGVVIDGEAHAYSLNLLNSHEIVNDSFGELPVAAVW